MKIPKKCKAYKEPFPHVRFDNRVAISFNSVHDPKEHNFKNAQAAAKLYNKSPDEVKAMIYLEAIDKGNNN